MSVRSRAACKAACNASPFLRPALTPELRYLLESPSMFEVLAYTDVSTFEVASDAFLTFKQLLPSHPALASSFLLAHSEPFFDAYNSKLLASQNYVTRRQSIKARAALRAAPCTAHAPLSCWARGCRARATWRQ